MALQALNGVARLRSLTQDSLDRCGSCENGRIHIESPMHGRNRGKCRALIVKRCDVDRSSLSLEATRLDADEFEETKPAQD